MYLKESDRRIGTLLIPVEKMFPVAEVQGKIKKINVNKSE